MIRRASPEAQAALDRYLDDVAHALAGSSLDVGEILRDVEDHVEEALEGTDATGAGDEKRPPAAGAAVPMGPGATTTDLVDALRRAAPDSLEYLVEDWFETLTFHEVGVEDVVVTPGEEPLWQVTVEISFAKIRSDGTGDEQPVPPGDWIDVGVRGEGGGMLALERQFVDSPRGTFTLVVRAPPASVVVDPGYRLLERDRADNTALVDLARRDAESDPNGAGVGGEGGECRPSRSRSVPRRADPSLARSAWKMYCSQLVQQFNNFRP